MKNKKVLHLVTQNNQPFGSMRKCCERCGLAIHAMPTSHGYVAEESNYTEETATMYGEIRCVDLKE